MNKEEQDYTRILLRTQKDFLDSQKQLSEVLIGVKDALKTLNDTNVLHCSKDDDRYLTINKLATAVEARSKVMNTIMLVLVAAIVVLAGAEKALTVLKIF